MNPTVSEGYRNGKAKLRQPCPDPAMNGDRIAAIRPLRILVPINANDDSRWGVAYAQQLHAEGRAVEVCLLNVGEPIAQWEVLRFRTQAEITRFQSERAQAFLEEASRPLVAQDIPCRAFYRQGQVVFSILDAAEELECDEIIMPNTGDGLAGFFSKGIVEAVQRKSRNASVVLVEKSGTGANDRPCTVIRPSGADRCRRS